MPALGTFQQRNAATAIRALETLDENLRPTPATIEKALAAFTMPGRMELIPSRPRVVFDIAHNADEANQLAEALRTTFPQQPLTFVIAIGTSKDAAGILGPLFSFPARLIFTSFEVPGREAVKPEHLGAIAKQAGKEYALFAEPNLALGFAYTSSPADGVIVVTGATFIVSELRSRTRPLPNIGLTSDT